MPAVDSLPMRFHTRAGEVPQILQLLRLCTIRPPSNKGSAYVLTWPKLALELRFCPNLALASLGVMDLGVTAVMLRVVWWAILEDERVAGGGSGHPICGCLGDVCYCGRLRQGFPHSSLG